MLNATEKILDVGPGSVCSPSSRAVSTTPWRAAPRRRWRTPRHRDATRLVCCWIQKQMGDDKKEKIAENQWSTILQS